MQRITYARKACSDLMLPSWPNENQRSFPTIFLSANIHRPGGRLETAKISTCSSTRRSPQNKSSRDCPNQVDACFKVVFPLCSYIQWMPWIPSISEQHLRILSLSRHLMQSRIDWTRGPETRTFCCSSFVPFSTSLETSETLALPTVPHSKPCFCKS